MRVAVTGGTGHIGVNLVRALVARGDEVTVLSHGTHRGLEELPVRFVEGDVRDPASLRATFEGAELVFHLAAVISIDGDRGGVVPAVNVEGARSAACTAHQLGVRRFVHFCSIHAFDPDPADQPLDETRARAGTDPKRFAAYDRSKAAGERAVRGVIADGLDAVILHPSGVIGPGDYVPSRMGSVFLQLYRRTLPAMVPGGFDWVDVRDVVATSLAAADRGRCGESYLVTGRWAEVRELAAIATRITGVPGPRITVPSALARLGAPFVSWYGRRIGTEPLYTEESLAALCNYAVVDHGKAARELGHAPRSLEDSLRDLYADFVDRGVIPPFAPGSPA